MGRAIPSALAADVGYRRTVGDFGEAELVGLSVDIPPVSATSGRFNLGFAHGLAGR